MTKNSTAWIGLILAFALAVTVRAETPRLLVPSPSATTDTGVPLLNAPKKRTAPSRRRGRGQVFIGRFSLLNKVTGKVREIKLRNHEPVIIENLTVIMFSCLSNPPEEVPDTRVFLQVFETEGEADGKLFSGWMFASSPSIHALDHPVYDLWPLACTKANGSPYTGADKG